MDEESIGTAAITAQPMYVINRLNLKAYKSESREALIFTMLNDTIHLIRYDRALLWSLEDKKPKLLGISGETEVNRDAAVMQQWNSLLDNISDPSRVQIIEPEHSSSFKESLDEISLSHHKSTVLWFPIFTPENELVLGLWLELWVSKDKVAPPLEMMNLMLDLLIPSYGAAWKKFQRKITPNKLGIGKPHYSLAMIGLLILSFIIQVPSRIVAPCEVVAMDPYVITAPLEGIINKVFVEPGERVSKGTTLFEYNKEVPLQHLEIAKREVMIIQSEAKRAAAMGLQEEQYRKELPILSMKLEKEKADLNLAQYHAEMLVIKAPEDGVVTMDNPDDWTGKPVQIGEKVMSISNPRKTKVRIWIPENDNTSLEKETDVQVMLNIDPTTSLEGKLMYVSNQTTITEKHVPSYIGEVQWVTPPKKPRLGLKGTAIIYGEKTSLFYFFFRKPISYMRSLIGF